MAGSKKKNILEFLCSLEVPPQVRYTDEQDAGVQADICTPMSTNSLCHNRKKNGGNPSVHQWIRDKQRHVLSAHKYCSVFQGRN